MNREGLARYPSLYEINTKVWLCRLSQEAGKAGHPRGYRRRHPGRSRPPGLRLDLAPERVADRRGQPVGVAQQPRLAGRVPVGAARPDAEDISGSGFAIAPTRSTKRSAGRRPWPRSAPGWPRAVCGSCSISRPTTPRSIIPGSRRIPIFTSRAASRPWRRRRRTTAGSRRTGALASWPMGAIPYFPGWPDTLQLDYANPALQAAQVGGTAAIAEQCDGVRCDMAMLLLPEVFQRTWGRAPRRSGRRRSRRVRRAHPGFTFMAEAYWDLEWDLQQQGFDYATTSVCTTACAMPCRRPARPSGRRGSTIRIGWRASSRTTTSRAPRRLSLAAASGGRHRHLLRAGAALLPPGPVDGGPRGTLPVHLCRGPVEAPDAAVVAFYDRPAGGAERTRHVSRRRLVVAPAPTGLGRQSDVAGFHRLCLASAATAAAASSSSTTPVIRRNAVCSCPSAAWPAASSG